MIEHISRRKLIGGLGLLIAAPAIVRASSLMPVKALPEAIWMQINFPSQMIVEHATINGKSIHRMEFYDGENWREVMAGDLRAGKSYRVWPFVNERSEVEIRDLKMW